MVSQLIAIDSRLRNHQFVIDQIASGFAVLELDATRDGLGQIADYLASHSSGNDGEAFGAIHLLSHGSAGKLQLGSLTLDSTNLAAEAQTLAKIHSLLAPGADLLVYGCDVAQGAQGKAFVTQLAKISGLDVAASTNLTGGKTGDWMLETTVGQLQAQALRLSLLDSLLAGQTINGTSGNDTLNGTAGNDTINGLGGDDWIDVGNTTFGSDTVNGESGADWISFSKLSSVSLNVNLADHTATSNLGSVALTSIEKVAGTSGADSLTGGEQADMTDATGNRVTEWLRGNGGNDTLTGGAGADFAAAADYSNNTSGQAVNANLRTGVASDGLDGTDKLVNIDFLVGGAGNDSLTGGSFSRDPSGNFFEIFRGNAGNDTLDGSNTSSDGDYASSDRADYSRNTSAQAVNVNLASGQTSDGMGGTDTLISIDQVYGGPGKDTLLGGSGGDTFDGGAGNDSIDGGAGSDQVRYQQSTAAVIVNLSASSLTVGGKTVAAGNADDGMDGTDTLISIENVRGSDFNDYIRGSDDTSVRQFLSGVAGSDTIDGGLGVDIVGYGDTPLLLGGITASLVAGLDGVVRITDKKGGIDTLINIEGLSGTNSADSLTGSSGSDYLRGQGGSDTLDGGAGNDWVLYNADPGSVTINLQTGQATDGWNGANGLLALGGTDTLKNIENAEGSDFNDSITGSSGDNQLVGRLGNDTLLGGAGRDTLDGGLGNDSIDGGAITDTLNLDDLNIASYASATGAVTVSFDAGTSSGAAGNDVLRNINMVIGSASTDALTGSNRTEFAEFFEGGAGDDTIDGLGGNFDVAMFSSATGGVTANLATGIATGAGIGTDTLRNVEALFGSNFADSLTGGASSTMASELFRGNGGNDTIDGGSGNDWAFYDTGVTGVVVTLGDSVDGTASDGLGGTDVLRWIEGVRGSAFNDTLTGSNRTDSTELLEGREGNDVIDGKGGLDTAWYKNSRSGVNVDLSQGKAINDGYGTSDTLINIENVYGSRDFNDLIKGDAGDNRLEGNGGKDTLMGGAGEDYILGGTGDDSIDGGTNTAPHSYDWASYDAATGAVQVNLSSGKSAGADGIDTLTGIEAVSGSSVADTLTGDANTNILRGNGGDDTIDGGDGFDIANYYRASGGVSVSLLTNTSTGADGADTLIRIEGISGSQYNDTLTGDANNNWIGGNAGDDSLGGGSGIDTAYYHRATGGVTVNLTTGRANGADGNDTLDGFENIAGSFLYADSLTGDQGSNLIEGNGGNDTLTGGAGNDTLQGGDGQDYVEGGLGNDALDGGANDTVFGFDWVGYQNATGAVQVNLSTGIATGADGNDTLASFDAVAGGTYADRLTGDAAAINVLRGNGGDDTLDGGSGFDYADYSKATGSVTVSLVSNTSSGFDGVDTLISIEGIRGGQAGDTLSGDANDNWIRGNGGNDSLDGGAGIDTTDYYLATGGVSVNLGNGRSSGADGSDTLTGFENVRGSFLYDDNLAGDSGDNKIDGNGGNDTLVGAGGNDTLLGGDGNDSLDGGAGRDTLDYSQDTGAVTVSLQTQRATDGSGGQDTVVGFEQVIGSAHNDVLTGTTSLNDEGFAGGAGNDTIDGGAITDTLNLSNLNIVSYQAATAAVNVNLDTGLVTGGAGLDLLKNINMVLGSAFNDTLTGSNSADIADLFDAGAGDDVIDGGAGSMDFAMFSKATAGVTASLTSGTASGAGVGTDTLKNIEALSGSDYDDALTGSDNATETTEYFKGNGGNDTIDGRGGMDVVIYDSALTGVSVVLGGSTDGSATDGLGGTDVLRNIEAVSSSAFNDTLTGSAADEFFAGQGGKDTIDGKDGFDTAYYFRSIAGVNVDLSQNKANNDGYGSSDVLLNMENVVGSRDFNDFIAGNSGDNQLLGLGGNDTLMGGAGQDVLQGGDGRDTLDGGAGNDTLDGGTNRNNVSYSGATTGVIVNLITGTASDGQGGTDALININQVEGTAFKDQITIGAGGFAAGNGGDDLLTAGFINDSYSMGGAFNGGTGNDTIVGSVNGSDLASYSMGARVDGATVAVNGAAWTIGRSGSNLLGLSYDAISTTWTITDLRTSTTANDPNLGTDSLQNIGIIHINGVDGAGANFALDFSLSVSNGVGKVAPLSLIVNGSDTEANDSLTGTDGPDLMLGFGGNDTLLGNAGDDTMMGGNNDDLLSGGTGNDFLDGGAGNDTLDGGYGNDTIYANGGSDSITTLGGNDQIFISDTGSTDTIDGGTGWDNLYLRMGADTLTLSGGNILGIESYNLDITTSAGSTAPRVTVSDMAFAAAATTHVSVNAWSASAALDIDASAAAVGHNVRINGGNGNDTLVGGAGDDVLWGNGGNDSLSGGSGNDIATYYFSQPQLMGLTLSANNGSWTLSSGTTALLKLTADTTNANSAWTVKDLRTTTDAYSGLSGTDTLNGIETIQLEVSGSNGPTVIAANLDLQVNAGTPSVSLRDVNTLGTSGNDTITGTSGNDTISAFTGADSITALAGDDQIVVNDNGSTDTIDGGTGRDTLTLRIDGAALMLGANSNIRGIESFNLNTDGYNGTSQSVSVSDTFFTLAASDKISVTTRVANTAVTYVAMTMDAGAVAAGHAVDFTGGNGNDTLIGGSGDDFLTGYNGNDYLMGGYGNDTLTHGQGSSTIDGGAGVDTWFGDLGNNRIDNASLQGNATTGWNFLLGGYPVGLIKPIVGTGTWTLQQTGSAYSSTFSNIEFMQIRGVDSSGAPMVLNISVDNSLTAPTLRLLTPSDPVNETLVGTAGNDTIYANGGSDSITTLGGNDQILITDDGSTDTIDGGDGWDRLTLRVDGSALTLVGGNIRGVESFTLNAYNYTGTSAQTVVVSDTSFAAAETGTVSVGAWGAEVAFNLDASATTAGHSVQLYGGNKNDTITGGAGDDYLQGGYGNDTLIGGYGNDTAGYNFGQTLWPGIALASTGSGAWTLSSNGVAQFMLQAETNGTWTVTDVRNDLTTYTTPFGVDTLTGIEMVGLDGSDSSNNWYRAGNLYIGGTASKPTLQLRDVAILGTDGNNILNSTTSDDQIYAFAGSDSIWALGGDDRITITDNGSTDTIDGGAGNDTLALQLDGSAFTLGSNTNIRGIENFNLDTSGLASTASQTVTVSDSLFASADASNIGISVSAWVSKAAANIDASAALIGHHVAISGGNGNDTLVGGAGNDYLQGGNGNDSVTGGDGNDTAAYNLGPTLLPGLALAGTGIGAWTLSSNTAAQLTFIANTNGTWKVTDVRTPQAAYSSALGEDTLSGVEVVGLEVQDSQGIWYRAGNLYIGGTASAPTLQLRDVSILGTKGNDAINGTASIDLINAFTGADSITALAGDDQINLTDNGSTDTIDGGDGNDTLNLCVDGSAFTLGSNGNIRGVENFILDTSSLASNAVQSVTVSDSVFAYAGASNISVEAWNSNAAVNINASAVLATHSVSLRGNNGDDTLIGGAGDDYFWGNDGSNYVVGGAGNDTIVGTDRGSTMDGGAGFDTWQGDVGQNSLVGATLSGNASLGWSVVLAGGVLGQIKPLVGTGTWTLQGTGETAVSLMKNIERLQMKGVDANGAPMTLEISVDNSLTAPKLTIVNRAPTAVADVAVATEAGGVSNGKVGVNPKGNVLSNDTDPDTGDTKTVFNIKAGVLTTTTATAVASGTTSATGKGVSGTYGGLKIGADGSYVYTVDNTNATVNALNSGSTPLTDTFTYSVKDAAGLSSSTTLTVTINGANDAPVNTLPTATPSTLEDTSKAITGLKINDVDAGSASFSVTLAAANGTLSLGSATGVTVASNNSASVKLTGTLAAINSLLSASKGVTYTPTANFNGSTSLTMTTNDGSGGTDTDTLAMKVTPVNDAPTGAVTISGNAVRNGVLSASNTLADVDLMGNLAYQWLSDGTAISGATASTFTMLSAQVNHSISLKLSYTDGGGTRESVTSGILRVGSTGADTITGLASADTIDGGDGADSISGGDGNDFLTGGKGNDTLDGGAATDTASYASASVAVTINLATTSGKSSSSAANDVAAIGADTLKNLENIIGSGFGDKLTGDANANVLCGKLGNDTLTGGAGADVFVLDTATGSGNVDTILDFTSASDKIQLSKSIFTAAGSLGDLASAAFWSGAGVVKGHDANDRFVYNKTDGNLYYDADGYGTMAAVLIATLGATTYPTLLYSDLQIIG